MGVTNKVIINKHYNDINPVVCGEEDCAPKHSYGPAVRTYWLLHFVMSGKGRFKTCRGTYELKKNDVFIIRPYDVTSYIADADEPWSYRWIGFNCELSMPKSLTLSDVIYAPYLSRTFEECVRANDITQNGRGYESYLCSKIWQIFAALEDREETQVKAAEEYIRSALNIMDGEYMKGITVDGVAARLHLNRSYFSSLFTAVMKMTPSAYLSSLRMNKAAELLYKGGFGVAVTAASVGYSDTFVFSRAFKNYHGVSPSDYAAGIRSKNEKTPSLIN